MKEESMPKRPPPAPSNTHTHRILLLHHFISFLPCISTCLITAFQDHLNWTMTLSFSVPAPGYPGCSQRFSSRNSLPNSL